MNKEIVKYPNFSEIDFIRLYCATNYKNSLSPIINHQELERRLYKFYHMSEFRELFQDICPKKDSIYPENSYLDLGTAFQTAQIYGLLTPIHGVGEVRSIISCDDILAKIIIDVLDPKMVDKMSHLFDEMFDLNNKEKSPISDAESVMNGFNCDKENSIELDEESIDEQEESYKRLLNSNYARSRNSK